VADQIIRPDFTDPWIRTADVSLAALTDDEIDPSDLEMATPFLVERIVITEDTLQDNAVDPGVNWNALGWLNGRWWVRGCQDRVGPRMPLGVFDTSHPQVNDHYQPLYLPGNPSLGLDWVFRDFERPVIPVNGSIYGTWENPAVARIGGLLGVKMVVGVWGVGKRSGKPTWLQLNVAFAQSPGGGAPGPTGPASGAAESTNRLEEEILVRGVNLHLIAQQNVAFIGANWDERIFSHLRFRLRIEPSGQSLTPDGNLAPLVAYGQTRQGLHRTRTICLRDNPVLLSERDSIGFEFGNTDPVVGRITRAIVSLVGRTPNRRECGA
jgi:hypothetical protein